MRFSNFILIIPFVFVHFLFAQISQPGNPKHLTENLQNDIHKISLSEVNRDALLLEDDFEMSKDVPYRFGTPFDVQLNLENSGYWEDVEGGKVWRLSIHSPHAYSINLLFSRYVLPEGAELFIYDEHMETVLGAFTSENNKPHETFSTSPTQGETTILEYFEPSHVDFAGEIEVSRVVHAYRDIFFNTDRGYNDSGSCNNNVNCPDFSDWTDEVRSVAMILTSGGSRICTGALVNNTRQDLTPYFLTANHCLGGESNWIFMFEYESEGCSNQDGPTYMTVQGSTLLDNASTSDYALLELDETPPDSYNIHYAGWSAVDVGPVNPVAIHHPSGDIKKISFDYDTGISDGWSSNDGSHWRVADWEDGTTEPGSSGSPLFDNNHRIVGQLHGGEASCSYNVNDYYGKVSTSWSLGLSDYLDPDNTGLTVLDGIDAIDLPDPELTFDATEFQFELESNDSASDLFSIENTGEAESILYYSLQTSPFEEIGDGPDGGYYWTDTDTDESIEYEWIDISESAELITFTNNDDSEGPFDIGFEFPFYDAQYSQLNINPNGWLGFGVTGSQWDNTGIPSSSIAGPAIFGFWDDLNPENDGCNEYCSGNVFMHSNSDRMVIWFNDVAHWWANFENSYYNFQIVLYANGEIAINYQSITGTYAASVGIQESAMVGSQVSFNQDNLEAQKSIVFAATPDWLTVNPTDGELLDGESQTISVNVNSDDLVSGEYNAFIRLVSSAGSASIPVSLLVDGGVSYILGDANGDLTVDVLDVVMMVNLILNGEGGNIASDVNQDGELNVQDIILTVNIILEN